MKNPAAIHCLTAWGQWAVDLLQHTASLPGGSGQWNTCNTLPHCLGGSGQWTSCNTLPHCLGAVGSRPPAIHCLTAWGQWAVELLQYTASLPGGSGQWAWLVQISPNTPMQRLLETPKRVLREAKLAQWGADSRGQLHTGNGGLCCVVLCCVVLCCVVLCCVVLCCVVLCCVVLCCGVLCRRRCYQKAKGRDVYPRVKVNGLGCVCCVRAVRKCVGLGRGRGSRGDLVSSPLATALFPGAPAAPLQSSMELQPRNHVKNHVKSR